MKHITHCIAAFLIAVIGALAIQAQTFDTSAFSHKMDITFNGCGVAEPNALEDFPALIVFDPAEQPTFSYADFVSPDGADLRFVDALGLELAYEIDTWNAGSDGRSLVWARIPVLHSNTVVTAFWGSPVHDAPSYAGADGVWANGYVAVWHLNEGGGAWVDSTGNGHALASYGSVAVGSAEGANGAGAAASFSNGAYLVAPDADGLDGMSALTLEAWVKDTKDDSQARAIFSKRNNTGSGNGCYTLFQFSGGRLNFDIPDSSSRRDFENSFTPLNTWTHAAVIFDGAYTPNSVVACFMDGALVSTKSASAAAIPDHTSSLCIGTMQVGSAANTWIGSIDEARISNVARTPAWIAANHASMGAPFAFAQYGAVVQNDTTVPVVVTLPAQVSSSNVVFNGFLVLDGGSDAYVTTYWGPENGEKDAAAWSNAITRVTAETAGSAFYDTALYGANLKYARDYYVRHYVQNDSTNVWSADVIAFTTYGVPAFGAPSASYSGATVTFGVRLEDNGASDNVTVQCLIGAAPETLATLAYEWTGLDSAQDLACDVSGLTIGATYYYAFVATSAMPDDALNIVTVHTATNSVTIAGTVTWTAGAGANTDWNAAANWSSASVPGAAASAIIPAPGFPVTAVANHAIGSIHFSGGSSALDVGGAMLASSTLDIGGRGGSSANLTLSNGTLAVSSVNAAAVGYTGSDSTLTLNAGARLAVNGIYVGHSYNPGGHSHRNKAIIEAGGVLESSGIVHIGNAVNDYYYPDGNELRVNAGGLLLAKGINIGSNGGQPRNNRVVIDGGAATNSANFDIGMGRGQYSALVIQNGGSLRNDGNIYVGNVAAFTTLSVESGALLDIGGSASVATGGDTTGNSSVFVVSNAAVRISGLFETSHKANGHSNRILLYQDDGWTTTFDVAGEFKLGRAARNNVLQIYGGALNVSSSLNTAADSGSFAAATNNQIRIVGASAKIRAATMNIKNKSVLGFTIPNDGFDEIPIIAAGAATLAADTRVEIDAGEFSGIARLMQAASMPILPDENFTVTTRGGRPWKLINTTEYLEIKVSQAATFLIIK